MSRIRYCPSLGVACLADPDGRAVFFYAYRAAHLELWWPCGQERSAIRDVVEVAA